MRRTALLTSIIVIMPHVAYAHVVRHSSVPQAYWGTWATSAETCTSADKKAIVLAAKTYVGPAASCDVDYVSETAGAKGAIYSARLLCSAAGGGTQKKSAINLIIMPDGADRISVGPDFDRLVAYQRCAASETATKQ